MDFWHLIVLISYLSSEINGRERKWVLIANVSKMIVLNGFVGYTTEAP